MTEPSRHPLLTVRGLSVTYTGFFEPVRAVRNLDLTIHPGEAVGLVGESGSGKSTVALAITGLLPAAAEVTGSINYEGQELTTMNRAGWQSIRGRRIAMIFQDPMTSLNPYLSVGMQVAEPAMEHFACGRRQARRDAIALLESMGVPESDEAFHRYPHEYSGGMRQRVMIASSFAGQPGLLIADEPTTALDVLTQARILGMMRRRLTEQGLALLLITHDLGIVAGVCDRVIVMREGLAVEDRPVRDLYRHPRSAYAKRLLASVPRLDEARVAPVAPPAPSEGNDPAIEVTDLTVCYAACPSLFRRSRAMVRAVDQVSLRVEWGEVLGLVGQSGSGKSTLVRAIAGLLKPVAGSIRVAGAGVQTDDRAGLRALRRDVQMVFQDPLASLDPRFTAERIIAEPLVNFGLLGARDARLKARDLMARVQLDPGWANRYPHEFSGGQCQRLGIARALAVGPRVLLCDEPVSALDVSIQADILSLLVGLREDLGLTIVFISHDLAVVRHIADRVAVMHEGRIVEAKSATDIYAHAEHPYTQSLLAAVPIPDPEVYRC